MPWGAARSVGLTVAICTALQASAALAEPVADFYRGKTISLVIGVGEGGGYDLSARLMAQHLSRFIPGNPAIVPHNMTGASSVVAAQFVYNVAPKDGTVLATFQPTIVSEKVMDRSPKYEPERFTWIGRLDSSFLVGVVWHTSPVQSIAAAKQKQSIMAAQGASGTAATVPWALNRMIGTKFKVVLGYPSSAARALALERGEVDGMASAGWDFIQTKKDWLRDKKIKFLYTVDITRSDLLPDTPALPELATNDRDRRVLWLLASTSTIGRALVAPPGIPVDRMSALRHAFDQMVKDPAFLEDAKRRGLGVEPLSGPALQKVIGDTMGQPEDVVAELKAFSQPPK